MIPTTTHTPAFAAVLAGRVVPCSPDGGWLELTGADGALVTRCIG